MHDGDRRIRVLIFLHEQKGDRFTDDHAAAEDDHVRAADIDLAFDEQTLHAKRGAWNKAGRISEREACNVLWMEAVHIFAWIGGTHDGRVLDLLGRRGWHENTVNGRVAIQLFDTSEQFRV